MPKPLRIKRLIGAVAVLGLLGGGTALSTTAAADSSPTIMTASDTGQGDVLTDASGRTVYLFTRDSAGTSNCNGACMTTWPPVISDTPTLADGVTGALDTLTRPDGSHQVTYNGWPLYYFSQDSAAGDMRGQGVGKVWYVINPTSSAAAPVATRDAGELGTVLTDSSGRTLYRYTRDTANTSNCSGGCAATWPPLTVAGAPMLAGGVPGVLSILTRDDGTEQVAYNGMPLYYYARDSGPQDTTGQGVGNVWYIVNPADS